MGFYCFFCSKTYSICYALFPMRISLLLCSNYYFSFEIYCDFFLILALLIFLLLIWKCRKSRNSFALLYFWTKCK